MPPITSATHHLARQLLAGERASGADIQQAAGACDKLRIPLTRLAGGAGFSSLLSRALALAKRHTPSLEGLRVEADGTLAGFEGARRESTASQAADQGGIILLAELLGLLVMFIGEPLTLNLVREGWPDVSLQSTDSSFEEKS